MQEKYNEPKKISANVGMKTNAMIKALEKTLGNVTEAAKIVGIDRDNHYIWLKKYPEYKEAFDKIQDSNIDFVESTMYQRINGYEHPETKVFLHKGKIITQETIKHYPPDSGLIKFFLETIGKKRGYIPRVENVNKSVEEFDKTEEEIIKELQDLEKRIV